MLRIRGNRLLKMPDCNREFSSQHIAATGLAEQVVVLLCAVSGQSLVEIVIGAGKLELFAIEVSREISLSFLGAFSNQAVEQFIRLLPGLDSLLSGQRQFGTVDSRQVGGKTRFVRV